MSRAGAVVCSMRIAPPGRRMTDAFITALEGDASEVLRITDSPGWNWTATDTTHATHASGGLDDIATQLHHRPAETGRARLSRRASLACQRSTPSPVGIGTALGSRAVRRPI